MLEIYYILKRKLELMYGSDLYGISKIEHTII